MCPINGLLYNAIKFYEKIHGFNILILSLLPKGVTHFKKNFGSQRASFMMLLTNQHVTNI